MAIQVRRGNEVNFDPNKMLPGEWAVSLDTKYVRMCFSPGVCVRMATYEGFEEDMARIEAILEEAESIEEAIEQIQTEINTIAIEVENYAKSAEQSALEAKEYAAAAAESAEKAEAITGPVVSGLKGSAETDYRTGQVTITPENLGLGEVLGDIDALAQQFHTYVLPKMSFTDVEAITEYLDNGCIPSEQGVWYRGHVNINVSYPAFNSGGSFYLEGFTGRGNYQWQTMTLYNPEGLYQWERSKMNGAWGEWSRRPTRADLANYLPLTGGAAMTGPLHTQNVRSTSDLTHALGDSTHAWTDVFSRNFGVYRNAVPYGSLIAPIDGTTETNGVTRLSLGNSIPSGTEGNSYGFMVVYGKGTANAQVYPNNSMIDTGVTLYLPNASGTLALTSDIKALNALTEVEQTTVAYFIDYIFSNFPVSTTTIYSSTFLYNGYYTYSGIKPVDNYASFIIHGYGIRAIHMQLQNGVWVYSAMDNK